MCLWNETQSEKYGNTDITCKCSISKGYQMTQTSENKRINHTLTSQNDLICAKYYRKHVTEKWKIISVTLRNYKYEKWIMIECIITKNLIWLLMISKRGVK